jgi:cytoskeletal protein RodZ
MRAARNEVGCVRVRRYFESQAKEEPGIDPLSRLVDGQRAAPRERLRLEKGSFFLSTLVHAVVLSAVISRMDVVQFAPVENQNVEVEMVTKLEVPATQSPRPADEPAVQPSASELRQQTSPIPGPAAPTVNPPTKSAMIKAPQMLSGKMLADPRSQGVTQALAQMNVEDRAAQICSIEAMGQIAKNDSRF